MFAPVGNESPTGNNDGVDKSATTTATETPATAFLEAQSLLLSDMSPGLLIPRCLDQPSVNSESFSNTKSKTNRGAHKNLNNHNVMTEDLTTCILEKLREQAS